PPLIASSTAPILPPQSARGLEESPHSSSPDRASRCRPTPATAPVPPRHSQTLPKAPPEEISSTLSSFVFRISAAPEERSRAAASSPPALRSSAAQIIRKSPWSTQDFPAAQRNTSCVA